MKIGIIGGGSIGLLFAYYLSEHESVTLYVHSDAQLKRLQSDGLILEWHGEKRKKNIAIKLFADWCGEEEVTIIAVKQYHLPNMLEHLYKWNRHNNALLFLQNGMGHIKWLHSFKSEVYLGSVEHGAMKTVSNYVVHKGVGITKIAPFRRTQFHYLQYFQSFKDKFFPFVIEEDYEYMLTRKLIANAVINPLTAVLNVANGELISNDRFYQIVKLIYVEIEQSLALKNGEPFFDNVLSICKQTANNRSSMLRDLEEKRPTEIDAILGYILEKAEEKEINTPVIKSFYYAIKGKECRVEG